MTVAATNVNNIGGKDNSFGYDACPATGNTDGMCPVTQKGLYGIAALKKQQGNDAFKVGKYREAINLYSEAIKLVPDNAVYVLNRSKAYFKFKQDKEALVDAEMAMKLSEEPNVKACWHRCVVLAALDRGLEAQGVIEEFFKTSARDHADNAALISLEKDLKAKRIPNIVTQRNEDAKKQDEAEEEEATKPEIDLENCTDEEKMKFSITKRQGLVDQCFSLLKEGMPDQNYKKDAPKKKKNGKIKQNWEKIYDQVGTDHLVIKGGHQYMERPDNVKLPKDYKKQMGTMTIKELEKYDCHNQRILISIMGNIYDCSDRPDKYSASGPYYELGGRDLTWPLYSGQDEPSLANLMYDLFAHDSSHVENMMGLCAWCIHFEQEYGKPIGQLYEFRDLGYHCDKPPEMIVNKEACTIM